MASFLEDNADLRYYLDKGIDWAALAALAEQGFRQADGFKTPPRRSLFTARSREMVGTFAAEEVAPHAAELDRAGVRFADGEAQFPPRLAAIFDKHPRAGAARPVAAARARRHERAGAALLRVRRAAGARRRVGDGAQRLPRRDRAGDDGAVDVRGHDRARPGDRANRQDALARRDRRDRQPGAPGAAWTSPSPTPAATWRRCARRRRATRPGSWFITGQKIFITSGHGKYHFVIARTGTRRTTGSTGCRCSWCARSATARTAGASGCVTIDRLEEKMGQHASATAALRFDAHAGRAGGPAGRRLPPDARAHQPRAHRRRLRVDRPVRGGAAPGARLCERAAVDGSHASIATS